MAKARRMSPLSGRACVAVGVFFMVTCGAWAWSPIGPSSAYNAYVSAIAFPTGQPSTIYVGTYGCGGFFKTNPGRHVVQPS